MPFESDIERFASRSLSLGAVLQERCRWKPAEKAFRLACRLRPDSIEPRLKLAEILWQQGRDAPLDPEALPWAAPRGPLRRLDWFRLLILSSRFAEAFQEAEAVLDGGLDAEALRVLDWPWGNVWPNLGRANLAFRRALRGLATAKRRAPGSPWPRFYSGMIKRRLNLGGWPELESLARAPARRYGWMLFELGRMKLYAGELRAALLAFRRVAGLPGGAWKAHAYLGEIYACLHKRAQMGRAFRKACAAAPAEERGAALAWWGGVRLWLGEIQPALDLLERAAGLGARYAYCWRGAAKILLGRPAKALPDLRRAIELKPWDQEAWIWRAEAYRRLNRPREALKDLRRAEDICRGNVWVNVHRALVLDQTGDQGGLAEEYRFIRRSRQAAWMRRRLGLRGPVPADREAAQVIQGLLRLNPGYRGSLAYPESIWLSRK